MAQIKSMVRSHVEEAGLLSIVGAEVSLQLPNDASPSFQGMLAEIDARKTELDVNRHDHSCRDAGTGLDGSFRFGSWREPARG